MVTANNKLTINLKDSKKKTFSGILTRVHHLLPMMEGADGLGLGSQKRLFSSFRVDG